LAPALYPPAWACHPLNAGYVRRFLSLAARHGISVYWVIPPMTPEVHARREREGQEALYTRFVRETQAQFPNVTVLDGRRSGYGLSVHTDPLHLDHQGALAFSLDVADLMARRPPGRSPIPQWVDLPAYRVPE